MVASVRYAKTDEPIEMPFGYVLMVPQGTTCLVGSRMYPQKAALLAVIPGHAQARYSQPYSQGAAALRPAATSSVATCSI